MPYDIIFIILLIVIVTPLTVYMISYIFSRLWCRPKRIAHKETPEDFNLKYDLVRFSSSGIQLQGWFIPANSNSSDRPVVIGAHGWSKNSSDMLSIADELNKFNFNVLLYDARGHGDSQGRGPVTIRHIADDIIAAIKYIESNLRTEYKLDGNPIGLIAHSLSASSAILVAATNQSLNACICSSAFADPVELSKNTAAKYHVPYWPFVWIILKLFRKWAGTSYDESTPKKRIKEIKIPLLLMHGENDRYIPPSNLDDLYANSNKDTTERLIIDDCRHSNVINDPVFKQSAIDFFEAVLK